MITAIDTAVLIAVDQGEADAEAWVDVLAEARGQGALCICEVVAAEYFAVVMDADAFTANLRDLGVEFSPASRQAACRAGEMFRCYRDAGGPREHRIADFLIAAHAAEDCDRLASPDRGYLRDYFPRLPLLAPPAGDRETH
jgi:predicted nucleic acid-binding protein